MTLTLLLDLDDTLLVNKMEVFIPVYLQKLSSHLATMASPDKLVATLLSATRQMMQNNQPGCTLKEVFDINFYPQLSLEYNTIRPAIDKFYAEIFPSLQEYTQLQSGAVHTVQKAFENGYRIAIATNPLFPRTAIVQRLTWAGLPPEQFPFALIPSYETFHFAKPNPAYFAELLGQMGWPEGPVLMVGDDPSLDIEPARQAGIKSYWVDHGTTTNQSTTTTIGKLSDLPAWLEAVDPESLQPDFTSESAMIAILRATPAVIKTFSQTFHSSDWKQRPFTNEWSFSEIACHLRDVENEVNLPRINQVLQEENPFLPGKDTDAWADERKYICQDGLQALEEFVTSRQKMLNILDKINPEDWQSPARHALLGPTNLKEIVNIIASHDRIHIQQVFKGLNKPVLANTPDP